MNIYLITRTDAADYDEYGGFVIRAESEDKAREAARLSAVRKGGETRRKPRFWIDGKTVSVECIAENVAGTPSVLLAEYHAG